MNYLSWRFFFSFVLIVVILYCISGPNAVSQPASTEDFSGILGYYAACIDQNAPEFSPRELVEYNETLAFPLASTFKIFVLLEVLRAVDSGALVPNQWIPIHSWDRSLDWPDPPNKMRLRTLVTQMIWESHNSSADTCFNLVGLGAPSATLARWELPAIRVVLPTREFWIALTDPYGNIPTRAAIYAAMPREHQIAVVERVRTKGQALTVDQIERDTEDFYDFTNYDRATTFNTLDNLDNAATPKDMVQFLYRFFQHNELSPHWSNILKTVMARGDGGTDKESINVPLDYWGGKGGSDLGMGNVCGYGITSRGNHIFYAVMGSHMIDEDRDWDTINALLGWIFDALDTPPTSNGS
jgi:beta-lactamase class A